MAFSAIIRGNTYTNILTKERHSFGQIARRTAFSFFLFSVVLVTLLSLSWFLLVPELTRVEVGGSVRGLHELREYKSDLEAQISTLESQRGYYLMPVDHDLYDRLKRLKNDRLKFQYLRRDINEIMVTLVHDTPNAVQLSGFYFDAQRSMAEIRGQVHNVGPRSMTVLAQFVEELHKLPEIITIESSRYTRMQRGDGSFYSPFTLRLNLSPR